MIAEQLAIYLHQSGFGTQNLDLFHGFQPSEPNDCIVVYDESASVSPDSHTIAIDEFGVQILVRNTSYSDARDKMIAIHRALVGFGGRQFTDDGLIIGGVFVDTTPTSIGKDNKGRNEWSAHYRVRTKSEGDTFRS